MTRNYNLGSTSKWVLGTIIKKARTPFILLKTTSLDEWKRHVNQLRKIGESAELPYVMPVVNSILKAFSFETESPCPAEALVPALTDDQPEQIELATRTMPEDHPSRHSTRICKLPEYF